MFKWLYFEHTENKLKRLLGANIPKTAEELALDKKRKKNQQFWDDSDEMDRQCSPGNSLYLDNVWNDD